ncbi:MAG: hypothetical protein IJH12_07245 [Clostridia bacterium]|nr:hypothetical protein [Clostridia bacterium]
MGYLEVEDKRTRDYLKNEIVNTIVRFSENERNYNNRFVSLDESDSRFPKNEMDGLSYNDDCSVSFFEATSDNILDSLESADLINAISYLEDDEIDMITRLYVKEQDEFEIALDKKISVADIRLEKMRILDKIKKYYSERKVI